MGSEERVGPCQTSRQVTPQLRIAQFDRPETIRPVIRRWRNRWTDTPRTADYAMQVLSRTVAYAVQSGRAGNPCEGIEHLYKNDRSEIIWTDADVTPCGRHQGEDQETGCQRMNKSCKTPTKRSGQYRLSIGAGEGNRTLVCSLGSCRSTIELRPRSN
jgi:hypothetical protein